MAEIQCYMDDGKVLYPTSQLRNKGQKRAWLNAIHAARVEGFLHNEDLPIYDEQRSRLVSVKVNTKTGVVTVVEKPVKAKRQSAPAQQVEQVYEESPEPEPVPVALTSRQRLERGFAERQAYRASSGIYLSPFVKFGIPMFLIIMAILYYLPTGDNKPNPPGSGGQAPTAAAQGQAPAQVTPKPAPEQVQLFQNIGTDHAVENAVSMECEGKPLQFSVMLSKRTSDGRLEVTLVMNGKNVPIDALWPDTLLDKGTGKQHVNSETLRAPETTCGVTVTWNGKNATYISAR